MRLRTISFLTLAFLGLAYAAPTQSWLNLSAMALLASASFLAIIYMIGRGFDNNELQMMSKEEGYQLLATLLMIGLLFGAEQFINDSFSVYFGDSGGKSLQAASIEKLSITLADTGHIYSELKQYGIELSKTSTKSFYCTLSGIGFNIAPCNGFSTMMSPLSMAAQAVAIATAELSSLITLSNFAKTYSFQLLLPIGILLRTLKFTRGAGGLVIGLAVSLYLFLPLAIMTMDGITSGGPDIQSISLPKPECDVYDFGTWGLGINYNNADRATDQYTGLMGSLNGILYLFLVRGSLTTILALLAFISGLRWVSRLAGSEVDVSPLMRVS